ncbi:hypothetical protein [Nonomuraea sp. NPDC050643]|uniref:hypothetical protein n=1 Tax=Nonomuraea sp. NPDC050643 TaxID=3155660 RepID=UPI0033F2E5B3
MISAEVFKALTDLYLSHPTNCPCSSCTSMDALLDEMCNDSGCRKRRLPGHFGCDAHTTSAPKER